LRYDRDLNMLEIDLQDATELEEEGRP